MHWEAACEYVKKPFGGAKAKKAAGLLLFSLHRRGLLGI